MPLVRCAISFLVLDNAGTGYYSIQYAERNTKIDHVLLLTFQEHLFVKGYCQSTLNIAVRYWWRVQYVLFCANCVNEENIIRICKILCNFFVLLVFSFYAWRGHHIATYIEIALFFHH